MKLFVIYVNWFQLSGVRNQVAGSHTWLNVKYIPTDGSQYEWYRFALSKTTWGHLYSVKFVEWFFIVNHGMYENHIHLLHLPPKIGEMIMYFNGGTLQILLGALGNSNGGSPGPSTKMSIESPLMIVFDMLFRAVNIISYRLSIWYSRYSEAISVNSGSRFLNSFWGFWHESVWFNWERTKILWQVDILTKYFMIFSDLIIWNMGYLHEVY